MGTKIHNIYWLWHNLICRTYGLTDYQQIQWDTHITISSPCFVILYVQNLVSVGPLVLLKLDNDLKIHRNHLVILYLELFFFNLSAYASYVGLSNQAVQPELYLYKHLLCEWSVIGCQSPCSVAVYIGTVHQHCSYCSKHNSFCCMYHLLKH